MKHHNEIFSIDGETIINNIHWERFKSYIKLCLYFFRDRFGLYHVDFENPKRTRTPKDSVHFYKDVVSTKQLPESIPTEYYRKKSEDDIHSKS